jgi:hypothetical protein
MRVNWLEFAQRLAEGARAKVAEDRRRLEESAEQKGRQTKSLGSRHVCSVTDVARAGTASSNSEA